jgi:7-cyano-7-deazaguanine synthase
MEDRAMDGYADVRLLAPYLNGSKADIATDGAKYGTPFDLTWSCYKGGDLQCGRCGTCVERREAFHLAGVDDPTIYADADFWRAATGTEG